jgi:hypothetical protein
MKEATVQGKKRFTKGSIKGFQTWLVFVKEATRIYAKHSDAEYNSGWSAMQF